jgi:hypothetical protein
MEDHGNGQMAEQDGLNASNDMSRLQVEYWPLNRLIPCARNARTHSEAQVAESPAASEHSASQIRFWSVRPATSSRGTAGWLQHANSDWPKRQWLCCAAYPTLNAGSSSSPTTGSP